MAGLTELDGGHCSPLEKLDESGEIAEGLREEAREEMVDRATGVVGGILEQISELPPFSPGHINAAPDPGAVFEPENEAQAEGAAAAAVAGLIISLKPKVKVSGEDVDDAVRRLTQSPRGGFRGAGTWGKPKTLADHFARHGADFGARTADDYAEMASGFLRRSQAERLPTKIDSRGVMRVYDPDTNTFGAFNPNGTTRTFYKPDPAAHGYSTNLDYWNAQPGVAP